MRLEGKSAIVTGSGRGIGREIAVKYAQEGADVLVNYTRRPDTANETAEAIRKFGRKAVVVKADVANKADVENMVKTALQEFGKVDILVNNAGISNPAMLYKMSEQQWDEVVDIHLKGAFLCTAAVATHMRERKYGKIINVISTAGVYGTVGQINYASAKAGLIGFTKSASRELGGSNINVNCVEIGVIDTEMTEKIRTDPKLQETYLNRIQLRRFGKVEDVSPVFVFLGSDESSYITAQVIGVDGGYVG
ncbi:MAG TPA: 3-oxoacyl-ACP reductase FabG [Thermodesulfobacteriota bacterium]|nr:3-oxoacyl-ACP reductase FabG [Deltaproteobacteria bacterium]HNR13336.1 3-oxoacyl-ACP reductase FabG [Thermodesulfobacteriota bacterium]HNU71688.1 3-oxoacyl-ACP reductase FabG [Thermodesulfobacteriota bacterium]HOC37848.1 3-oxoacyl-ACP reductase FabG [Thermodesulfobacteriota bacterium]HQO78574.1 3-oxoacyl-ACP reductase FabG [Thermodesulfobacteriota bacterium]